MVSSIRDEEKAGYYCLLIAIFCEVNAEEARKLYQYGPEHPVCQKILKKHIRDPSLGHIGRELTGMAMKSLLEQGYSAAAVAEAFQCFPSTVKRRVKRLQQDTEDGNNGTVKPF